MRPLVEIDPPTQRRYLAAFDDYLRTGKHEDRLKMRVALEPVLAEAADRTQEQAA